MFCTPSFRDNDGCELRTRWILASNIRRVGIRLRHRETNCSQVLERIGDSQAQKRRDIRCGQRHRDGDQQMCAHGSRIVASSRGQFARPLKAIEHMRHRRFGCQCERIPSHRLARRGWFRRFGFRSECRDINHWPSPIRRQSLRRERRRRTGKGSDRERPEMRGDFVRTCRTTHGWLLGHWQRRNCKLLRRHQSFGKKLCAYRRGCHSKSNERDRNQAKLKHGIHSLF